MLTSKVEAMMSTRELLKTPLKPLKDPILKVDFVAEMTLGSLPVKKDKKDSSDSPSFITTIQLSGIGCAPSGAFRILEAGAAATRATAATRDRNEF